MSESNSAMLLDESFTVRLTMLSDWHIGTGAGIPGNIDALIARDVDGFPCIPAKSVVGIWRDAMEQLTYGLDNGNVKGPWSQWIGEIFGSQPVVDKIPSVKPRPSNLSLQPARIPEGLRNKIQSFPSADRIRFKQALTFIKPEIKIDEKSGTAEDEALRFVEMGRMGTILEVKCDLDLNGLKAETVSALLIASARLVERIGGKRRRGAGKCKFEIAGKDVSDDVINYLIDLKNSAIPSATTAPSPSAITFDPSEAENGWHKMDYTLELQTPVAIVTATLGNVSETLDFIPGTYLLPHLTKGKNLFKHIANGDIQVSPATIDVDGVRGLPVPKALSAYKVGGGFQIKGTVFNKFRDKTTDETPQLKPYREGYVSTLDAEKQLPKYAKTNITLQMHNTVQDDVQRPTSEIVGVYSRQAIAAGRTLHGEIRFKTKLLEEVRALKNTPTDLRLGTSKKDDYGLARLTIGAAKKDVDSAVSGNERLIVYFESDVLLRNENLRQTNMVEDLKRELEIALGEGTLNLPDSNEVQDAPIIHTRRIESWHEGWGFPRPTLIAMQAGSCVKFNVSGTIDATNLQALEKAGIGERRGEGYGRIRFNPKLLMEPINNWEAAQKNTNGNNSNGASPKGIEPEMQEFAKQLELTAWREELQSAVLLIADDQNKRKEIFGLEIHNRESVPPLSQIGSLRSAIMRMKDNSNNSKNLVINWLKHLEDTPNRIKKWDRNNNPDEAKKKTTEIKKLINDESKIWLVLCDSKINGSSIWKSPSTPVRKEKELQMELWAEAVRSLFDACMRAHKREGGEN